MKFSILTLLLTATSVSGLRHRHIKRENIVNGNVERVVYEEEVTYHVKKGPHTTVTEAAGTMSTFFTSTYGAKATNIPSVQQKNVEPVSTDISVSVPSASSSASAASVALESSETSTFISTVEPLTSVVSVSSTETSLSETSFYEPSSSEASSTVTVAPSLSASPTSASSSSSSSSPAASTTSVSSTTNDYSSSFDSDILAEHNNKRALHGVPELSWDNTLAKYAQDYADAYSCPADGALKHSGGPYGENLAAGYSSAAAVVDAWYNEIKNYDFSNPGFNSNTGHFTQVVWKDTSKLGCGYKKCDTSFGYYVVCSYSSAGNVIGTNWSEKVPRVKN